MTAAQLVIFLCLHFSTQVSGVCMYGNSPICVFPCTCQSPLENCDTNYGQCSSGCRDGPPAKEGLEWRGSGCRIGNVGHTKPCWASDNGDCGTRLTDGNVLPDPEHKSCSRISIAPGQKASWTMDLLQLHNIFNVTLFSSDDGPLHDLIIFVSTTDDIAMDGMSCAHVSEVLTSAKVNTVCHAAHYGRYVSIQYSNTAADTITRGLCEVAIMGHKVPDCSKCPSGAACDDLDGCSHCPDGYQRPSCTVCPLNHFGHDCEHRCHCKAGASCELISGLCPDGCDNWYVGKYTPTCHILLGHEFLTVVQPRVVSTTYSSVTILWQKVSLTDERFFKYMVYIDDSDDIPVYSTLRWQNELPSVDVISHVDGLLPNTPYTFFIRFWREINVTTFGNRGSQILADSKSVEAITNGTFVYIQLPNHATDSPHDTSSLAAITPSPSGPPTTDSISLDGSVEGTGLSTGVLVGIVIGSLVALCIAATAGACIVHHCHKKDSKKDETPTYCYINNVSQSDVVSQQRSNAVSSESDLPIVKADQSVAAVSQQSQPPVNVYTQLQQVHDAGSLTPVNDAGSVTPVNDDGYLTPVNYDGYLTPAINPGQ